MKEAKLILDKGGVTVWRQESGYEISNDGRGPADPWSVELTFDEAVQVAQAILDDVRKRTELRT